MTHFDIHITGPITINENRSPNNHQLEAIMGAIEDANAQLSALVAEDGIVIKGLDDLLAQAQAANGSVPASAVQSLSDGIKAEVARLNTAVQTDDPAAGGTPAPAPTPAPVDQPPAQPPVDQPPAPVDTPPAPVDTPPADQPPAQV